MVSGSYTLGGTHNGYFTGTEVIALGDVTNNLLTFDGDLGLSDVVLIKGNSMNSELPYFEGLKTVENATITIAGMQGEENSITLDDSITLRACGDIKDTIDMVNLVMTQNLSEITLKGTEPRSLITTNESNTQGAVKRMTGLFYTTPNKTIMDRAFESNIIPVYPYTAEICPVISHSFLFCHNPRSHP